MLVCLCVMYVITYDVFLLGDTDKLRSMIVTHPGLQVCYNICMCVSLCLEKK